MAIESSAAPSGPREWAEPSPAFLTALVTEHFVLQSMSAATTSEASTRASLYLLTLSSSLVSLGFAAQASRHALELFAAALLPTLVILGWLTVVRLTDTSVANVRFVRRMTQIHRYYARIAPPDDRFFADARAQAGEGEEEASLRLIGARGRNSAVLLFFTMATSVGVVTSVVLGSGTALLCVNALERPLAVAIAIGVAAALVHLAAVLRYQHDRFTTTFPA